ncbi:MAG TPA: FxsA family protein [Pseudobdellovibrionaceae bacterium]|nr:FxsA family protein [Pseudobdellovibrionaceae bacterium]
MPFFFFWSLFEFIVFFQFVENFGFFYSFLGYVLPSFLGVMIFGRSGQLVISQLQMQMMKGEAPAKTLLKTAGYYISGVLFLIPSFLTRVIGVLLWIPFVRGFLVAVMFKKMATPSRSSSNFRVFTSNVAGGFREDGFPPSGFEDMASRPIRDVTPVKVVPLQAPKDERFTEQSR